MTVAAGYCILPVLDQKKACQKGTFWSKTAEHFTSMCAPAHFSKVVTSTAGSLPRPSAQVQLFKISRVARAKLD
jgi:hypothetical protein